MFLDGNCGSCSILRVSACKRLGFRLIIGISNTLVSTIPRFNRAAFGAAPRVFRVSQNVKIGGALAAVQAVIPNMSERGSGSILLTGGGYSLKPSPD
jgi:hypothetical protein